MATFYLDYEGGNDANDGTTFANRWKTITAGATAARIAPGDTIRIMKSLDPGSLGNGTWTKKSATVTLAAAKNVLITDCESAWTAAANVTATTSSTRRNGSTSASLAIAAGFTTGKAAYFDLGSNQDYSAYQGITLWFRANAAVAASTLSIRLCSDATGDVTVDNLTIPAYVTNMVNAWVPLHLDKGSALGASIRSIALYGDADPGTVTVLLDNISTTKDATGTDCLTLKSLIGKNTATETFWGLRAISGTTLTLDCTPLMDASQASGWKGYWGTTETVTTYHRRPITVTDPATTTNNWQSVQDSGTVGNYITFSGGWDRTNMSTQDGETWFDHQVCSGRGISTNGKAWIKFEKLNGCRFGTVHWNDASYTWYAGRIHCVNSSTGQWTNSTGGGADAFVDYLTFDDLTIAACGSTSWGGTSMVRVKITKLTIMSGGFNGVTEHMQVTGASGGWTITEFNSYNSFWSLFNMAGVVSGTWGTINGDDALHGISIASGADLYIDVVNVANVTAINSLGFAIGGDFRNTFIRQINSSNCVHHTWLTSADIGELRVGEWNASGTGTSIRISTFNGVRIIDKLNDSTGTGLGLDSGGTGFNGWLRINDYDGTGLAKSWYGMGMGSGGVSGAVRVDEVQDSDRHTLTGSAWKITIGTAFYVNEATPCRIPLGKFYCAANQMVTASIWTKRGNADFVLKLVARKYQLAGMTSDAVDTNSAGTGTYEQLSINFTPTEAGVVEFEVWVYSTTTTLGTGISAWIDDLNISQ
jgi:hypothetical protein